MIRFGMCGCGGFIEKAILPRMRAVENAQPVAAFDVDKERLGKICKEFDIAQACNTFEELLRAEDVDVIYIASPNVFHKEYTILAAQAGKHVFCQKPMAMNAGECREMVEACRSQGVKLGIGFCFPFGGAQQRAKELIKDGAIGDVSHLYLSYNLGGYNPDTVGWRCNPKMSGGGPLMDLAPHLVNLACFFLDDKVSSVMAYVRPEKTQTEIELDVLAMLEFAGGARACMDTSFVRGNTHNYTIVGTKGQISVSGTMAWQSGGQMTLQVEAQEQDIPFSNIEHLEQEIRLYCSALEKNEEVAVSGQAGLHAQAVIDAIYESGSTGQRCMVEN